MNRSKLDIFRIDFGEDEVSLVRSTCKTPWACMCNTNTADCGLTPAEAQKIFIRHYQNKASHISSLTPEQFMVELGFYDYEE